MHHQCKASSYKEASISKQDVSSTLAKLFEQHFYTTGKIHKFQNFNQNSTIPMSNSSAPSPYSKPKTSSTVSSSTTSLTSSSTTSQSSAFISQIIHTTNAVTIASASTTSSTTTPATPSSMTSQSSASSSQNTNITLTIASKSSTLSPSTISSTSSLSAKPTMASKIFDWLRSSKETSSNNHTGEFPAVTTPSSNSSTSFIDTKHGNPADFRITSDAAFGIFLVISLLLVAGGFLFIYFRKKRKLPCKPWLPLRKRRSSTSSLGPLTQTDSTSVSTCEAPPHQEREFFSIGDQDGGDDGRPNSSRARQETEDDYFYDEMFERSAFVDETTIRANKHLTVDDNDEEKLASFNIPDLIFKKPMKRV